MPALLVLARDPLVAEEAARVWLPAELAAQRWHGGDLSVDLIFEQLGSADLFASRRAFLYINVLELKLRKAEGERLAGILAHLPASTHLAAVQVFDNLSYGDEEKLVKGAELRRWAEHASVQDQRRAAEGAQGVRWLVQRARLHGLTLASPQAQQLLQVNGGRLSLCEGELLKLASLKQSEGAEPVADAVLDELLAHSPAVRFWELVDAILAGAPDAQARLAEWHSLDPEGFRLMAELRRRLLALRSMQRGEPVFPPYLARSLTGIARRWPQRRLAAAIEHLAELEWKFKSGMIPGESSKAAELSGLQVLTQQLGA